MDSSSQNLEAAYSYQLRSYSFEEYHEVFLMLYGLVEASASKDAYKLPLDAQAFFADQGLIQMYLLAMFCFKNLDIMKMDFHIYEDSQEVVHILVVGLIFTFLFLFLFLFPFISIFTFLSTFTFISLYFYFCLSLSLFTFTFTFTFLFTFTYPFLFILSSISPFILIFKFARVFSIFNSIFYFNAFKQIFNFYILKRVMLVNSIIIIIVFVSQF